ncbi:MAG: PEP-CTERM sorting domain-containing protein [Verrucomicrobia bacterium]|nr:PEP-CTERM sorting domain-containing protein [Verrucomicrobiota bacterium]
MKNMLFPPSSNHIRQIFAGGAAVLSIMLSPTIQAQSDNFNDGNDTTPAWTHYAAGGLGQTFTFPANPADATSAYRITSAAGTSINPGRVGSYMLGGPEIPDFTITTDLIDWNNASSQNMGVMARVQAPPGGVFGASFPLGYALVYANRFSATGGGTDQLRLYKVVAGTVGFMNNGLGGQGQFGVVAGGSAPPNPTNDYQLVFTGYGNVFTGQIIDKSTGLAMTFNNGLGGLTDRIVASDPGVPSGFGPLYTTGTYGYFGFVGAGAIDPTFDNFSVVPEPSSLTIAGLGLAGFFAWNTRRLKRSL